jgi:predicted RecB family nuclease
VQQRNGHILFSPSDLNAFLECEHLTQLELAVARGELGRPEAENPQADLVKRKGDEHERAYLAELEAASREVVTIPFDDFDFEAAARATEQAMRAGADVIYQACFVDGDWRGLADFVERRADGRYEVVDTKLARHSKPAYVLQLCFYSEQVGRIQGLMPEHMHVVLGNRDRDTLRVDDFLAYYHRVRERFVAAVDAGIDVYPLPVSYCDRCDFLIRCEARWRADDHLSLVARMRRDQTRRLEERGIATVAALARAADDARPPQIPPRSFETLRDQAAMQVAARATQHHEYRALELEPKRGFELLPPPSDGDLFFDIEGDPFWEPARGLEYLWGIVDARGRFTPFWAHDRAEERRAVEAVIALIRERRAAHPDMHVFHYAAYETTALRRLTCEYGTREEELDDLLRGEVFVDLYKVVSQGLRLSHERYGLKQVETFYFERTADLRAGDDSILLYEDWLERRDTAILDAIAAYNREDCLSTLGLRDWLLEIRPGPAPPPHERAPRDPPADAAETEELRQVLLAGLPDDHHDISDPDRPRWLLAQLLLYHRREEKPAWWAFFSRLGLTSEELQERDPDAIGGLEPDGPPIGSGPLVWPFTFPEQQHRLGEGDGVYDPATGDYAGAIDALDEEAGTLRLRRGPSLEEAPLPRALIPGGPIPTVPMRAALRRLARSVIAGNGAYAAAKSILVRDPFSEPLPQDDLDAAKAIVAALDGRHLMIQGPPGTGKTFTAARLIVHLMRLGRRVGVTAQSHKVIGNLIAEVERAAGEEGFSFRGLKKGDDYDGPFVASSTEQRLFSDPDPDVLLLAGTYWLFSREDVAGTVDTLFVDEAGQVSLADALAVTTSARNVVLLGDPQQLAQVSQGIHPPGVQASVLEHLLDGVDTVPPERGLFLSRSFRMHPDVCRFISETSYEGRLHSVEGCALQRVDSRGLSGTGLRRLPVEHAGNRGSSPEEADRIAEELALMIGGSWTDRHGREHRLGWDDVLVVTPYNAQVRALARRLDRRARVGTVDRFQGQEAPVVFFSMATSSGDDLPRNLEFLFSRNRLNVAISRSQSLAVLVASPQLLEIRCRTIEQMRMVNALCRFAEEADRVSVAAG